MFCIRGDGIDHDLFKRAIELVVKTFGKYPDVLVPPQVRRKDHKIYQPFYCFFTLLASPGALVTATRNATPRRLTIYYPLSRHHYRYRRCPRNSHVWLQGDMGVKLRHALPWYVIIASIGIPILGADFLCHYELLLDPHNTSLIDLETFHRPLGSISSYALNTLF